VTKWKDVSYKGRYLDRWEKSLADLLSKLNAELTSQVKALKEEKQANQSSINRLNENKEKWKKGDGDIVLLAEGLSAIKVEMEEDRVEDDFFQENCNSYTTVRLLFDNVPPDEVTEDFAQTPTQMVPIPSEPFTALGQDEKSSLNCNWESTMIVLRWL
jgi:hypothetical protein